MTIPAHTVDCNSVLCRRVKRPYLFIELTVILCCVGE